MAKKPINPETENQGDVATLPKQKLKKPSMYRVVLLNDDFTPMEFVVSVLQSVFDKTATEATEIMLEVHRAGVGVAGIYTREVAETKAAQVLDMAQRSQHPMRCKVERV